jgi:hypothetical protein
MMNALAMMQVARVQFPAFAIDNQGLIGGRA